MNENYSGVPRSLSFIDLAKSVPGSIAIMQRNDKKEVDNLLWQFGFDTFTGYEFVECNHRALTTNQPIFGVRIEGVERGDKEWLASGMASTDAKIESCKDKTLREELLKLNKTGSSDRAMVDQGAAKFAVKDQKEKIKQETKNQKGV